MLGGVDSVAPFITVNEQCEFNPDRNFHSSIASFASGIISPEFISIQAVVFKEYVYTSIYNTRTCP